MSDFDPNDVGVSNGNVFGFPVTQAESTIILIPLAWDVTASYGKGTSRGPQAIIDASTQLDFHHDELKNAHHTKVFCLPVGEDLIALNDKLNEETIKYIDFLERGGKIEDNILFEELIHRVNSFQIDLKNELKNRAITYLDQGKIVAVIGGEHSVPLGLLEALAEKHKDGFGVLQLDAHADLRNAYEGFEQSHASIFFNALKIPEMTKLVQVGIRDIAPIEVDLIEKSQSRIKTFYDKQLKKEQFSGVTWQKQCANIIKELPQKVYISFDIDALDPKLCPNTGTPVPGGLSFEHATFLISELINQGKQIIGFDLCEVATGNSSDWDANVGARILWELVVQAERSRKSLKPNT